MKIQYQGHEFRGTPGEWSCEFATMGNGGERVAMIEPSGMEDEYRVAIVVDEGGGDEKTMPANAQLIKSAPKLLQALIEAVEEMDSGDEPGAGSEWHTKARAAILQALGVDNG